MAKIFTLRHVPPRERVLLISCMDLRLIDNLVTFMAADNLTNRYDQYIMAGTGIAAYSPKEDQEPKFLSWLEALWVHLDFAYAEHHVRDVYIIQHRNCGMVKKVVGNFGISAEEQAKEWETHYHIAKALEAKILERARRKNWNESEAEQAKKKSKKDKEEIAAKKLTVQCFMMDLRGSVKLLDSAIEQES